MRCVHLQEFGASIYKSTVRLSTRMRCVRLQECGGRETHLSGLNADVALADAVVDVEVVVVRPLLRVVYLRQSRWHIYDKHPTVMYTTYIGLTYICGIYTTVRVASIRQSDAVVDVEVVVVRPLLRIACTRLSQPDSDCFICARPHFPGSYIRYIYRTVVYVSHVYDSPGGKYTTVRCGRRCGSSSTTPVPGFMVQVVYTTVTTRF